MIMETCVKGSGLRVTGYGSCAMKKDERLQCVCVWRGMNSGELALKYGVVYFY